MTHPTRGRGEIGQAAWMKLEFENLQFTGSFRDRGAPVKIERTPHFGAKVVLHGASLEDAAHHAARLALEPADVDLMLETRGLSHARPVREELIQPGYSARFLDLPE